MAGSSSAPAASSRSLWRTDGTWWPPPAPGPPRSPDACLDSLSWTEKHGESLQWKTSHDTAKTYYLKLHSNAFFVACGNGNILCCWVKRKGIWLKYDKTVNNFLHPTKTLPFLDSKWVLVTFLRQTFVVLKVQYKIYLVVNKGRFITNLQVLLFFFIGKWF